METEEQKRETPMSSIIRNHRFSRRGLLGAAAIIGAAGVARNAAAQAQPRKGGTLRYGLSYEPRRMNQLNTTWMTDATQHLYDRLLTRDPDGKYVAQMATWTVAPDALSWTFKLKPGIKFHSGDPVTSAAVKWWFEQALDPKGFYGFKGSYSAVDSVETTDDLTIVVKLKHPDAALAYILYTVYSSIHNPKTYEKVGKDSYGVDTVDGTGPFKLKEFTPGRNLIIVRNDEYAWAPPFVKNQGPPWLDAISYRFFADDASRTAAIEAGDMDIIVQPSLADVDRLKQNPDFAVISKPMPATRTVYFNMQVNPWSDKRVRQAMAHAIQRQPIVDKLLFGQGLPAYSVVPPFFKGMYLKDCESYFPYDIKKAKELLAAAGLNETDSDGFVKFEGKTWEPEMLVVGTSELLQLAQVVQAQAGKIGIKIKILQVDAETSNARTLAGNFGILTGFYLWDGPDTILDWWIYSGNIPSTNRARLRDARVDATIEKMRNAATLESRYEEVKELQRVLHGDLAAIIPVYHPLDIYCISKKVHGYQPDPMTLYPRMHDVWMEG
jgi:peptide/nickel transport system substrate-binding protein